MFLNNSTVTGNRAASKGGGIYELNSRVTLTNSTVSSNEGAYYGGGIGVGPGGGLTLTDSKVSGNDTGGANSPLEGGGAIWNYGGTVSVNSSILSGNYSVANGGAIWTEGGYLTISNSIVSGNSAIPDVVSTFGNGGGIYVLGDFSSYASTNGNEVTISNSTITGNTVSQNGGWHLFLPRNSMWPLFMSPCSDTIVDGNIAGTGNNEYCYWLPAPAR